MQSNAYLDIEQGQVQYGKPLQSTIDILSIHANIVSDTRGAEEAEIESIDSRPSEPDLDCTSVGK